ncbi:MAG: nucleotidyltransferase domain-containing protein [Anaerolineales bacterium]|nr:nucleotidyltransferase domain-containing protein [Anaerolineales bacterium]
MRLSQIRTYKKRLLQIAEKFGVKQVYVFGSTASGEASPSSDIDLLIEMAEDASVLGVGGFQYEAQNLLGVHVDVVPTFALKNQGDKEFAKTVEAQAVPL